MFFFFFKRLITFAVPALDLLEAMAFGLNARGNVLTCIAGIRKIMGDII